MDKSSENTDVKLNDHLVPLKEFLIDLYKAGGIPLVLLGLAAANLFLPFTGYENIERIGISTTLALLGGNLWYFSSKFLFEQKKTEIETNARQQEIILKAICDIAVNEKWDVATVKIEDLRKVLVEIAGKNILSSTKNND